MGIGWGGISWWKLAACPPEVHPPHQRPVRRLPVPENDKTGMNERMDGVNELINE